MLADLEPRWLVFIGIAGALQNMRRFDVALASKIHDLRTQHFKDGERRFMPDALPVQPVIERLVASTVHVKKALEEHARGALLEAASSPRERDDEGRSPDLSGCFPTVRDVPISSASLLVDDAATAKQIADETYYAEATDMESIGVAEACYESGGVPCLIIRGISDEIRRAQSRVGSRRLAGVVAAATFEGVLDQLRPLDTTLTGPVGEAPGPTADPSEPTADPSPAATQTFDFDAYYSHAAVKARCDAGTGNDGDALRLASFEWLRERGHSLDDPSLRPLIIEGRHVHDEDALPGWDLAALLLFTPITFGRDPKTRRPTLDVDITGHHEAIYDNRGKRFMADHYYGGDHPPFERLSKFSDDIHSLQMRPPANARPLSWPLRKLPLPLRWSSGGFLPIVIREDEDGRRRRYFALFFRDIAPIGWNIANGASETPDERHDLRLLAAREAAEELVVLGFEPDLDQVNQSVPTRPLAPRENQDLVLDVIQKLTRVHREERERLDDICLKPDTSDPKPVDEVSGPADVRVHYEMDGVNRKVTTKNVYITVNPLEFGIEVTQVGIFRLEPGEYLIDGETYMNRTPKKHVLVRRPVALFDVDWFEEALRTTDGKSYDFPPLPEAHGAAKHAQVKSYAGCRRIPVPPPEHFELYDYDVKKRRQLVNEARDSDDSTAIESLETEAKWLEHDGWEKVFRAARAYADAEPNSSFPEPLRYICSAAWKAMCMYFQHRHV